MPPKKFTRTQLRFTDICESDHTLQGAASIVKSTTALVLLQKETDGDDEDDFYGELGGQ